MSTKPRRSKLVQDDSITPSRMRTLTSVMNRIPAKHRPAVMEHVRNMVLWYRFERSIKAARPQTAQVRSELKAISREAEKLHKRLKSLSAVAALALEKEYGKEDMPYARMLIDLETLAQFAAGGMDQQKRGPKSTAGTAALVLAWLHRDLSALLDGEDVLVLAVALFEAVGIPMPDVKERKQALRRGRIAFDALLQAGDIVLNRR